MIRRRYKIKVKGKSWGITVFFPLTCYHVNDIMRVLQWMDCGKSDMRKAYFNLTSGQMNNGLTFSNYEMCESVIVFAMSETPEQYFNLIVHELHHLSVQIGVANGLDLTEEEVCYINGDVAMLMFPLVSRLFCECKKQKRG